MPSRNTVQIIINAEDKASGAINAVVGNLQDIGEAALKITGAALAGATAAVVGFGATSLATFGDFQKGINEVFTLLPGITEDAMRSMESDVQAFMEQTGRLSEEAIPAIYQAISAGVPKDNVFDFLTIANQAAVGGATELETAVNGITSAVNAYGSEVLSAGQASDVMFTAVRLGKTTFGELSDSMFQVTTVAAGMGVAFGDVLAGVATLTSQGVPTSVAMTQIRQALLEMNDAGTQVGTLFQSLAGKSFADFIAEGHTLADAFQLLAAEAERTGVPIEQLFGSVEAGQAALALTGANMDTFTNNIDEMANSAGATEAAFNQMNQGIGMALTRLGGRWESLLISMGRLIEPFVTPLVEAFSTIIAYLAATLDTADPLNDWLTNLPQWLRPAVFFLGEMAVWILKVAESLGSFIGAINAGVPFLDAFQNFLYNVAGFDVAYYFGQFAAAAQDFFTQVMTVVQPIIDWVAANVSLQDVLIALGIAIATVVIPAVAAFFAAFAPLVALIAAVAALRAAWENDFLGMRTAITNAWTEIQPILESIGTMLSGLWTAIQEGGAEGAAEWVMTNVITPIGTALSEGWANIDWGQLATNALAFLGNAFLTLVDWATWVYDNWLVPLFDNAKTAIENFDWFQLGSDVMTGIGGALKAAFDFVAWLITNIFSPFVENSEGAAQGVDWKAVVDAIMGAIAAAFVAFLDFALWVKTNILDPFVQGALTGIAATDWSSFGNSVMDAIAQTWPNVSEWVQTNIIGPIQAALATFNPFNEIQTTNPAGNGAGLGPNGGPGQVGAQIIGRQFGGGVSAGMPTWVGEQGRELFVPPSNGTILNNRDSEQLASGGGKPQVVIYMTVQGEMTPRAAKQSAYNLKRELEAQGFQVN